MQTGDADSKLVNAIDCWRFVSERRVWELDVPVVALDRLVDVLADRDGSLHVRATGCDGEDGAQLQLEIVGTIRLVCQRCLGPVSQKIEISAALSVVRDEAQVEESAEIERSLDDLEDVIVSSSVQTLEQLVEDEILLSLPIAAMHSDCAPNVGNNVSSESSPFAGLREKFKSQSKE